MSTHTSHILSRPANNVPPIHQCQRCITMTSSREIRQRNCHCSRETMALSSCQKHDHTTLPHPNHLLPHLPSPFPSTRPQPKFHLPLHLPQTNSTTPNQQWAASPPNPPTASTAATSALHHASQHPHTQLNCNVIATSARVRVRPDSIRLWNGTIRKRRCDTEMRMTS